MEKNWTYRNYNFFKFHLDNVCNMKKKRTTIAFIVSGQYEDLKTRFIQTFQKSVHTTITSLKNISFL
jgi:hypothetical protein